MKDEGIAIRYSRGHCPIFHTAASTNGLEGVDTRIGRVYVTKLLAGSMWHIVHKITENQAVLSQSVGKSYRCFRFELSVVPCRDIVVLDTKINKIKAR